MFRFVSDPKGTKMVLMSKWLRQTRWLRVYCAVLCPQVLFPPPQRPQLLLYKNVTVHEAICAAADVVEVPGEVVHAQAPLWLGVTGSDWKFPLGPWPCPTAMSAPSNSKTALLVRKMAALLSRRIFSVHISRRIRDSWDACGRG